MIRLPKLVGTGEEEESGFENKEKEDIYGAGEVEQYDTEKGSRRRYVVVVVELTELQPPCNRERKDDDGIRNGVKKSIANAARLCSYSIP